jgi:hypothetical protein
MWDEQFYNPGRFVIMKLRLGAKPLRCAACRCNFASFRRRKEKFVWKHQERTHTAPEAKSNSELNKLLK